MNKNTKALMFNYSGINQLGKKITGEILAKSPLLAQLELYKQGLSLIKITKKRKALFNRITQAQLTLLTRQLATMLEAGIPLFQSLKMIAQVQKNKTLTGLINRIHQDVEAGFSLSEALMQHPEYFNHFFCNLIRRGEKTGSLACVLKELAGYKERIEGIKKSVKKALLYPVTILIIAGFVTSGLAFFVIPQFQALFQQFKAQLPVLTQIVVHLSELFQSYWYLMGSFLGVSFSVLVYAKKNVLFFAKGLDALILKTPLLGSFLKKAILARLARTLSLSFRSGLPLVETLESAAGLSANLMYFQEITNLKAEVARGQCLKLALKKSAFFPQIFIEMVALGEEAGPEALEKMLYKIATLYEEEIEQGINGLNHLLEPLLICFLGVLIGGLVIALYLPLFQLGQII